ncbi:MAG: DUF721 domain-containing protein [Bdellovibrionota bacterium]|nr:DUF721 domain-containing protein [Bdellovibrionota bacterium]
MFKKVSDLLGQNNYKKSHYRSRNKGSELFNFLDLIARWEEVVGTRMAKVTVPLKNQGKTLTILTNHSAYSQQLSMLEETLKKKIIATFPELRDKVQYLKFQVSTQHFDKEREDLLKRANAGHENKEKVQKLKQNILHPQSPQYKALRQEALNELGDLVGLDDETKERMVSIYIQNKIQ